MAKIKLLIKAKCNDEALTCLDQYEDEYGGDDESDLYKGQMLQNR